MSRPRSTDKSIPISVALPGSLVRRLDQELSFQSSRSKYVARAIKNYLDQLETSSVGEASTRQLVAALSAREDIDGTLRQLLKNFLNDQDKLKFL